MKKSIGAILGLCIISIGSVFAYTPSTTLETKLETVAEKLDTIIDSKGTVYRSKFLTVLENYKTKYSSNERATYILTYLSEYLANDQGLELNDIDWTPPIQISADGDYTGSYSINDTTYGTEVEVVVSGDTRTITSNAIANHEVGIFPNNGNPNTISAQDKSWELDLTPTYTGDANWARESGIAYNGVKFELETAERVTCTSGETYRIEAVQEVYSVGLDDFAHVQPTGEYHYHGASSALMDTLEGDDIVHVGYANDGFPLYYSKQGTYTPSYQLVSDLRVGTECTYVARTTTDVDLDGTTPDGTFDLDWEYVEGLGTLDSCNGTYIDGEYGYLMTDTFPFGPRCLNGETSGKGGGSQGGPGGGQGGGGERKGPPTGDRPPRQ